MDTLGRTYNPKHTSYAPDGSGRDRYIAFNNGGLFAKELVVTNRQKRLQFAKTRPQLNPAPRLEPTVFRYISDGSGRDYYVTYFSCRIDSGGLHPPAFPGGRKEAFSTNLRGDERRRYVKENDFFQRANLMWQSPSARASRQKQRQVVTRLTNRLYSPPNSPPRLHQRTQSMPTLFAFP